MVRRLFSFLVFMVLMSASSGNGARALASESGAPLKPTPVVAADLRAGDLVDRNGSPALRFELVAMGAAPNDLADPYFRLLPAARLPAPVRISPPGIASMHAFPPESAQWGDGGQSPALEREPFFHPGPVTSALATLALALFFFVRRTR